MPTLDQVPAIKDVTHLLLIADTKMGKSTYAAQAALDGFTLLYIDSDNGISALRHALRNNPEAMKRVIYVRTDKPCEFQMELFESGIFRWNTTEDKKFSSGTAAPESNVLEIIPSRIPAGIIIVNDSWTSTALDAMELGAAANKVTLENMGNEQQSVYGNATMKLNLLLAVYQHCPFNVMVLSHGTVYEVYEKPKGKVEEIKQKHMILLDSIRVPLSSSRPHGLQMGKYFTDIGWIEVDRMGRRNLDFKLEYKRVGGGRPDKIGPIDEMSFKALFGGPFPVEIDSSWYREMTAAEWIAANRNPAPNPAGVTQGNEIKATPAKPVVSALMRR